MEIKDYITINDKFLELEQISSLVKWLNNQKFEEAETVSGLQKDIRSASIFNYIILKIVLQMFIGIIF